MRYALLAIALSVLMLVQFTGASYSVTHLNVTAVLNRNMSASVSEVLTLEISNASVSQYTTNRLALNLTLSTWQSLVGPMLVQHLINPTSGVHSFKFLPGAVFRNASGNYAYLLMSYEVANATTMNRTGPRSYLYNFNDKVMNFEHGISGEVLPSNTTFTIIVPQGAVINSAYPIPDAPASAFTTNYRNVTSVSWFDGEPLSTFEFSFTLNESMETEVIQFFSGLYKFFGYSIYVIVALIIIAFIVYLYWRAGK